MTGTKRKSSTPNPDEGAKKIKLAEGKAARVEHRGVTPPVAVAEAQEQTSESHEESRTSKDLRSSAHTEQPSTQRQRIIKLAPPRPFPTVPTSASATGPRSAHTEGKNHICVTRKTELGAYLRRCKDTILKDGYKTLHLSAMGAAIPLAVQLSLSLPAILPHDPKEIHTEVLTGTVEVKDELIPEDDDEDVAYRSRGKSSVMIIIKIGDGVDEVRRQGKNKARKGAPAVPRKDTRPTDTRKKGKQKEMGGGGGTVPGRIIVREDDMDEQ